MNRKILLYFLASVLALVVAYQALAGNVSARFAAVNSRIASAEKTIEEIRTLHRRYLAGRGEIAEISEIIRSRGTEYTPIAFLEEISMEAGLNYELVFREPRPVRGQSGYMETSVWVEIQNVSMEEIVDYLHRIENSAELLRIRNLTLRRQNGLLRASFEVATVVMD